MSLTKAAAEALGGKGSRSSSNVKEKPHNSPYIISKRTPS